MDSQLIGAGALVVLAWVGFAPEFAVPEPIIIGASALTGSLQAASARRRAGFVKGAWAMVWAVIAGISSGLIIGEAVANLAGLTETMARMLPVYIFAIIGGRLVLWLATDIDVGAIGNGLVNRLTKK